MIRKDPIEYHIGTRTPVTPTPYKPVHPGAWIMSLVPELMSTSVMDVCIILGSLGLQDPMPSPRRPRRGGRPLRNAGN